MGELADTLLESWRASVPSSAREHDRQGTLTPHTLGRIRELGLLGLTIPERFGGAGAGLDEVIPLLRGIARSDRAVAMTLGLHMGPGTRLLVAHGSADQHARFLPPIAEGRCLTAFGATEPAAGSDLSSIQATATLDGDHLVLSGEKLYVTNGSWAGLLTVFVRTPELGGLRATAMVLLTPEDGYTVGAEEHKLGLRGSSTTPIHLDGVRVPVSRLLGEPATGQKMFERAMCWGRTVLAGASLGVFDAVCAAALEHTAHRRQGGRTLAQLPVVQEKLARLLARKAVLERLVDRVVHADDDALPLLSLAAKVAASEAAWEAADEALQLHGAAGFMESTDLPLLLRDARPARIFEGANDVLLCRAGLAVVMDPSQAGPWSGPLADTWKRTHGLQLVRDTRKLLRLGRVWLEEQLSAGLDPEDPHTALWNAERDARLAPHLCAEPDPALLAAVLAG
ncbi:MAG: acyl-CoA dehydrogenase family protein [Myxococcota bacterium]